MKAELNRRPARGARRGRRTLDARIHAMLFADPPGSRGEPCLTSPTRPEIAARDARTQRGFGDSSRSRCTFLERPRQLGWLRKLILLAVLAVVWEVYARYLDNPLLLPTFSETVSALIADVASGVLFDRAATSLRSAR